MDRTLTVQLDVHRVELTHLATNANAGEIRGYLGHWGRRGRKGNKRTAKDSQMSRRNKSSALMTEMSNSK